MIGIINFYDGTVRGSGIAISGEVTHTPTGYRVAIKENETLAKLEIISDFENTIQVNGIFYDSLQTAVDTIANSTSKKGVIVIWDDINGIINGVTIPEAVEITIALEGHILQFRDLSFAIVNNGTLNIIDFENVEDAESDTLSIIRNSTGTAIKNNGTLVIGQENNPNNNSPTITGVQAVYGNDAEIKSGKLVTIENGQTGLINNNSLKTLATPNEKIRIVSVKPLVKLLARDRIILGALPNINTNIKQSSDVEIVAIPFLPEWTNDKVSATLSSSAFGILNIYSSIDEEQTKNLSYTVEYYKDNEKVEADTQNRTETVQILQPDTITVNKEEIDLINKGSKQSNIRRDCRRKCNRYYRL